jgi:hypothetical protein
MDMVEEVDIRRVWVGRGTREVRRDCETLHAHLSWSRHDPGSLGLEMFGVA